jgi:hypothetical protein
MATNWIESQTFIRKTTMEAQNEKKTLKQKLVHELSEYALNVIYLTLFFGVFAVARRLTLSHFGIYVDDYFVALIKALVIGKVIMIAAFLNISKKFEGKPLIIPVLYKVLFFILFVILFDVVEELIKGSIHTHSFSTAFEEMLHHHFSKMWLGGLLMVTLSFVPFFMLKELSRIMGREQFIKLFFRDRKEM